MIQGKMSSIKPVIITLLYMDKFAGPIITQWKNLYGMEFGTIWKGYL